MSSICPEACFRIQSCRRRQINWKLISRSTLSLPHYLPHWLIAPSDRQRIPRYLWAIILVCFLDRCWRLMLTIAYFNSNASNAFVFSFAWYSNYGIQSLREEVGHLTPIFFLQPNFDVKEVGDNLKHTHTQNWNDWYRDLIKDSRIGIIERRSSRISLIRFISDITYGTRIRNRRKYISRICQRILSDLSPRFNGF